MVINMPQWAMGISEGTINEWNVAVGDTVTEGQPLCVIDQNKVTDKFESPVAGNVKKLYVDAGGTVICGEPLLEIE